MKNIYANYVEKYQKQMKEYDEQWSILFKVRNFYRLRRDTHRLPTKCLLSVIPALIFFLITTILVNNNILQPIFMRYAIVSGFVLTFFVLEPMLNKKSLKKFKEFEHLIEGKTKTQIILADFNNYFERLKLEHKHRIAEDLKDKNVKEMEKHSKLNETLGELSKYCEINVKSKVYSSDEINEMQNRKTELTKEYEIKEKEYEEKIKELAIVTFFDKFFKEDFMQTVMKLMMISLCLMLYWSIPFAMEEKGTIGSIIIILNMILPFILCFVVYYIYRYYIRRIQRDAFNHVISSINNSLDMKLTEDELRSDINSEINNIRLKLVDIRDSIDLIDILLEQNEK